MRPRSSSCAVTTFRSRLTTWSCDEQLFLDGRLAARASARRPGNRGRPSPGAACPPTCRWAVRSRAIFAKPRPASSPRRVVRLLAEEQRAVAADVEALVVRPPVAPRAIELAFRRSAGAICRGVNSTSTWRPMISSPVYPNIRCAPVFHESIVPVGSHREDGIVGGAVDQQPQPFFALHDVALCLPSARDVLEHQHDAVDAIVGGAIRADPHQKPAAVVGHHLAIDRLQRVEDLTEVGVEVGIGQAAGDVRQRPSDIGGEQIEDVLCARRGQLQSQRAVEEDGGNVGGVDQILEGRCC